jgi:LAO/AO transport system kinase
LTIFEWHSLVNRYGEQELIDGVLAGERLALARLLTLVENDTPKGRAALDGLFPYTGKAHLIGVTGSPGTGKSSLVNQVAKAFRASGSGKVAVIAVDPSSPFTGGALLGDRIRMRDLTGDPGVFIRSMASRGTLGGLSRATASVAQVMDAAGFEIILIETVGAGQSEVDIARLAHTVVVVEAPGLGDDIQAIKAGILEIADIMVVNKCDLPGADQTARSLKAMLEMAHPVRRGPDGSPAVVFWQPPVIMACSTGCLGVDEIIQGIKSHGEYMWKSGEKDQRDRERLQNVLETLLRDTLMMRWKAQLGEETFQNVINDLVERKVSPFAAVEKLLGESNKP